MSGHPPKKGEAFSFSILLADMASPGKAKVNPTLTAGDFKVSKDGAGLINFGTLPTVIGSTAEVLVSLSPIEMTADVLLLMWSDPDDEWADGGTVIMTSIVQLGDLVTLGAGTTPLEVTVTDGVNPLDGAEVDVTTTATHTTPIASGYTDAFGKVTFHLDPGTYYVWVQHAGYNGTNPTAKVVS